MKKIFNIITLAVAVSILVGWVAACSSDSMLYKDNTGLSSTRSESIEKDSTLRLCFEDEDQLRSIIAAGDEESDFMTRGSLPVTVVPSNFVSLVSPISGNAEGITYYESLGYDSLVPNINFAKLLNIQGEMEVKDRIVKITPKGTYIVAKKYENEFRSWLGNNVKHTSTIPGSSIMLANGMIQFISTFGETKGDYSLISEGNYTDMPDDDTDDTSDAQYSTGLTRAAAPEPNFNDFTIFSADKKTVLGKLIQNIIGSTKAHTLNYNSKKRLKGSFYFYNYGVYSEIGVKGWTDKKNWIGWSKTANDEMRVGWRKVMLELPATSEFLDQISKNQVQVYYPPKKMLVGGKYYYAAQLVDVNLGSDFIKNVAENGFDHIKTYIRKNYKLDSNANLDKAEAFILANSEKIYMLAPDGDVVKYGEKSYCHTFTEEWMKIDADLEWCNNEGFKINGEKYAVVAFAKFIYNIIKQQHPSLVSGNVYVCARFDNNWRGMKINKVLKD